MAATEREWANTRDLLFKPELGRGVIVGKIGEQAVLMCWLTGKDDLARDMSYVRTDTGIIRAQPRQRKEYGYSGSYEPRQFRVDLLPYNAMSETGELGNLSGNDSDDPAVNPNNIRNVHIASNGSHINGIMRDIYAGCSFDNAISCQYVDYRLGCKPKLTAAIEIGPNPRFMIEITRKGRDGETTHHFQTGLIDAIIQEGTGLCVHENLGQNPPRDFDRDPYPVVLTEQGDLDQAFTNHWHNLHSTHITALALRAINLETGVVERDIIVHHKDIL
jgi:hypothetical protein